MGSKSRRESWMRFSGQGVCRRFLQLVQSQPLLFPLMSANPSSYFQETLLFHSPWRKFWGASQLVLNPKDHSVLVWLIHRPLCLYSVLVFSCLWRFVWPAGIRQLVILRSQSLQACPGGSISRYLGRDLLVDTYFLVFGLHPVKKRGSGCLRQSRYTG